MSGFTSELMRVLSARGFIHQASDAEALDRRFAGPPVTAYVGYDCTGPSLHVGHLLSIMMLRWLQKTGHRPITLMGGGTTRVGDPSGRDETRQLLSTAQIEANKESLLQVFARFLDYSAGPTAATMVDNADWLAPLNYIDFLRDVGRHFSVNRMLSMESVKLRLEREHELSFLEFNYMILQAYDFVELNRRTGCVLQLGGSDQWGNIVNGIELGRRMGTPQLYALTCPLLTTASGAKMGKTAKGAVWLNADQLGPYEYWQFWRDTEDADVGRFLRLFTELPLPEIERLERLAGAEINEAKKVLATEATALLHGIGAAEAAAETARRTFEEGETVDSLPTREIDRDTGPQSQIGRSTTAILVASGLVSSNSEARRKIAEGAVRINGQVVTDPTLIVQWDDIDPGLGAFKVQLGKKKIVLVKPKP